MPTANFTVSRARQVAAMAKIETTYGTDPTPAGGTDDVLTYDSAVKAAVVADSLEFVSEGSTSFTHQSDVITKRVCQVRFKALFQGSGTRGSLVNGYTGLGACLQACGMTQTVTGATSIVLAPSAISALKSVTVYARHGAFVHKVTGCVGNVVMRGTPRTGLECSFDMRGLYVAPVAVASLFSGWTGGTKLALPFLGVGLAINNGSAMLPAPVGKSFTFDRGIQMEDIDNFNSSTGHEATIVTDARPTLEIVMAKDDYASQSITYDEWFTDWFSAGPTTHAVSLTLGATSGNTAAFSFPTAQLISANPTAAGNHLDLTTRYKVQHATADTEFSITIT